jgi:signal recognition particle subunit SRP54
MGPVDPSLARSAGIVSVLLAGLQGVGKTTISAKLAVHLRKQGRKPLLVAADVYRPAAIDQLLVLGRKLSVPVFSIRGMQPVELAKAAVAQAKSTRKDVVIIDTAGRLAVDDTLMTELELIKAAVNPQEILFVADAMIGQDAVRTAAEFNRRVGFTGFVLTKLDGDARGGAALSIKAVTGKPVKLLGQGEELDRLEKFRPEGLAQRILGFGDLVGLMQDIEAHIDEADAEKKAKKLMDGTFSYEDFVEQMKQLRRMGPLRDLLMKMPFMNQALREIPPEALDEREMDRTLAIIQSMTNEERRYPDVLDNSRMRRIARGCGRTLDDVRQLHDRFLQARKMMQQMSKMMMGAGGGMPGMPGMPGGGGFPGMGGMGGFPGMGGMGGFPGGGGAPREPERRLTAQERLDKKRKRQEKEKARRGNR